MKPIIIAMLAVDAGLILAVAWTVLFGKWTDGRPRPNWTSLIVPLVIAAAASQRIADSHAGQNGADILLFGGVLLLGMALMGALVAARRRRGA